MSDQINTTPTDDVLTPEQRARVQALRVSREVLLKNGFLTAEGPRNVVDIITLAEYVLLGYKYDAILGATDESEPEEA